MYLSVFISDGSRNVGSLGLAQNGIYCGWLYLEGKNEVTYFKVLVVP